MKKSLLLAAFLGGTILLHAQSTDEAHMQVFARRFMAAYNQQDQAAIRKMYTDDAVRIDMAGKEITGGDKIAADFADQFRLNNATLLLRQTHLVWSDAEHAWVAKGTFEIYGITNVYDIKIDVAGQYANTMLKQNDEWKIARSVLTPLTGGSNVAIVDRLYKAFAKGDIPGAVATMDPNIVWNEAESFPYADKNPYIGPDAVLNGVFARIGAEWAYWNLTGIQLHEMANNMVLSTLRYQAKHKKTGKVIDSQAAHLFTLKDGKVVALQQFTDTRQVGEAMR